MNPWRFFAGKCSAVVVVVVWTLLSAAPAGAAIPGADNPKVFTGHDLRVAELEFNHRTLSQEYQAIGRKNPKWDADAVAFLDAMAIRFVNALSSEPNYQVPGGKTEDELLQMGKGLLDGGCDDPLVRYLYAALLDDHGQPAEVTLPMIELATKGLMDGKYSIFRAAFAQHRVFKLINSHEAAHKDQAYQQYVDAIVTGVATFPYKNLERRTLLYQIWGNAEADGMDREKQLAKAMDAADKLDPWLKDMILGRHEIQLAWESRGGDWANAVTEDGWRGFYDHLKKGSDLLQDAYKLHPDYPEAASDMITVTMGGGQQPEAELRDWFEKSVTAQFDWPEAYYRYLYAIYPRWHGSIEQMFDFGVECLETKRFDTRVPEEFFTVMAGICADTNSSELWQQPGVYEKARDMYEGYAKQHAGEQKLVDWYHSMEAAVAWRSNRFDESRRVMDSLKDHFDNRAFSTIGVMRNLAASHAYAMRPGLVDDVTDAERKVGQDVQAGIASYEQVLTTLAADDKARYFVRSRLVQLKWQDQFAKNQWISIQPEKDFAGWDMEGGTWKVDDKGGLVGAFDSSSNLWLACQAPFIRDNIVVEATIELSDNASVSGGIGLTMRGLDSHYSAEIGRANGKTQLATQFYPGKLNDVELKPANKLRCVFRFGGLSVDVNGKRIVQHYDVHMIIGQPPNYLAIAGLRGDKGATIRVTDLRIRKLRDDESNDPQE